MKTTTQNEEEDGIEQRGLESRKRTQRERLEESYGRDRDMLLGAEEAEEVDGVCVCVCVKCSEFSKAASQCSHDYLVNAAMTS
jgi:hypothetical protein